MSCTKMSRCDCLWSTLPTDHCEEIIARIELIDVMNFSATCRSWFLAIKQLKSRRLKSGTPTLLTSRPDDDGSRKEYSFHGGKFGLHDIRKEHSFCCSTNLLANTVWVGGKNDWLAIADKFCTMKLINIITGDMVPLPSFNTMDGVYVSQYNYLSVIYEPYIRTLRRVVICQTPSCSSGYVAIVLFSHGLLAYTSSRDNVWIKLRNPTDVDRKCDWYPCTFFDAIVHNGNVVAVDLEGVIYSWAMDGQCRPPTQLPVPEIVNPVGYPKRALYLAIAPGNELILVCVHGIARTKMGANRVLVCERDRLEGPNSVTLYRFDEKESAWFSIASIGGGQSLFLGLNYPFYGTWKGIKTDSVYVAGLIDFDTVVFTMQDEGLKSIDRVDYPKEEGARLLKGFSMRTPMWFRPTVPSRQKCYVEN